MLKNFLGCEDYSISYGLTKEQIFEKASLKEDLSAFLATTYALRMLGKGCDTLFEVYSQDKIEYSLGKSGCRYPNEVYDFLEELSSELKKRGWVTPEMISGVDIIEDGDYIKVWISSCDDTVPPEELVFLKDSISKGVSDKGNSYFPCNGLVGFINAVVGSTKTPLSGISIRPDKYNVNLLKVKSEVCIISYEASSTVKGEFLVTFWLQTKE